MSIVQHLVDVAQGKAPIGARRSSRWPHVRAEHLKANPCCAVCGGKEKLEVHHRRPFHLHPELELEPTNLITLCEANRGGVNCHLWFDHLGNFKSFNANVADDAAAWLRKFTTRPTTQQEQS